jgi:hypothetical protein
MDWFKTWCNQPTQQQLRRTSDGGYRLFYEARYHLTSAESLTGQISAEQLMFLGPFASLENAEALVAAGLWVEHPEDGWTDVSWTVEQDEMARYIRRKEGARTRQQRKRGREKEGAPKPPLGTVTDLSRVTSRDSHARRKEEKREEEVPARSPFPADFRDRVEQARKSTG